MRQLVRWILALKPAHPKKGESAFSMVFALLILLVVFRYLPSGFTKSNPFLSLPLFILFLIGALWMTKKLDQQLNDLPMASVFQRWQHYCHQYPDSKQANSSTWISILVYCPLLAIPIIMDHFDKDLMIPIASMAGIVLAYLSEAAIKALILKFSQK